MGAEVCEFAAMPADDLHQFEWKLHMVNEAGSEYSIYVLVLCWIKHVADAKLHVRIAEPVAQIFSAPHNVQPAFKANDPCAGTADFCCARAFAAAQIED